MTFDQFQRFQLAADLIEYQRNKENLVILDAGSHRGFLSDFLPGDVIYNFDQRYFSHSRFIQGDVLSLPFSHDVFDITIAIDILEHISEPNRGAFVNELVRTSSDLVIIGAPFANKEVASAERLALEFCEKMTGEKHDFLAEHLIEGLPDLNNLIGWTEERGLQTIVLPNGYLYHWFLMICLNFYLARIRDPWKFIFAVNRFYFDRFYRDDNREPAYRHFLVISKRHSLDPEALAERFISPPSPVPMPDLGTALTEINKILDLVHREGVSELVEKNRILREEKDALRQEKDCLIKAKDEMRLEMERARSELKEIKSTITYRICKKIQDWLYH